MSVLADLFVSDELTARNLESTSSLSAENVAQYRRFTEIDFKALLEAINPTSESIERDYEFEIINLLDGGERVTTAFPIAMLPVLERLTDEEIEKLARVWVLKTTIQYDPPSVLEPVIRDLRRLAAMAIEREEGLYLWNCV